MAEADGNADADANTYQSAPPRAYADAIANEDDDANADAQVRTKKYGDKDEDKAAFADPSED